MTNLELGTNPQAPTNNSKILSKEFLQLSLEDHHSANRLLSRELLQLPLEDRNALEEEIHGVSTLARTPEESPEFLEAALWELSNELTKIPDSDPIMAAYIQSQIFEETYINSADFRLRFLRFELFDAKKAAHRMVSFLDHACDLFGPQILQQPVTIADFTKEEEQFMQRGYFQVLPYRDRTGRPIYAFCDFFSPEGSARLRHKIIFYHHYIMSKDVETQQKGAVLSLWTRSQEVGPAFPRENPQKKTIPEKLTRQYEYHQKLLSAIPLRWSAVHFCLPDELHYHMLQPALTLFMSLSQTRFHYGRLVEQMYKLKTFGFPVEVIPLTDKGTIKTSYLKQWTKGQKILEERTDDDCDGSIVVFPLSTDVLFRRGASLTCHPGNSMLQNIIESKMTEHSNASQSGKRAITNWIINMVLEKGGRFLQWNAQAGWWTEIQDASQIRTKVANQVKLFKFKLKPTTVNTQVVLSSTFLFQNQNNAKRRKISHDDGSNSDMSCDCTCFFQ